MISAMITAMAIIQGIIYGLASLLIVAMINGNTELQIFYLCIIVLAALSIFTLRMIVVLTS